MNQFCYLTGYSPARPQPGERTPRAAGKTLGYPKNSWSPRLLPPERGRVSLSALPGKAVKPKKICR